MKKIRTASLLVAVIASVFVAPISVLADTKPYIKVGGGDVFTGGWFNSGGTACSSASTNYQAPTFSPTNNQYKGALLAFANGRRGSSSDFGAFAMGLIEGDATPTNQYGFYTGQTASTNTLSFANNNSFGDSKYWGGYLAGATQQVHCIPDYFGTKQNVSPTPTPTPGGTSFNVGNPVLGGQYVAPAGQTSDITAGADAIIGAGKSLTIFIDGNAYISHNISYAVGPYTINKVPKFALVVRGNIFVAPGVTNIDGLYIAQPNTTSDATIVNTGSFWTCHDSSSTVPAGFGWWVQANCGAKLTINGAVIAKQVNLLRLNGNLATAIDNETTSSANVAESINYIPAMVIGGPLFNQTTVQTNKINSLISLPPVF